MPYEYGAMNKHIEPRKLSRHPLTAVIVAFLLTGIAGTLLSNYYSEKQIERDRFQQITEARLATLQEFARLIYYRLTRAQMLFSSLRRAAPIEELKERKKLYDDAFVEWGAKLQSNLFLIRSVMELQGYSDFESHVEFRLVPIMREIDASLTTAYDDRLKGHDTKDTLKKCGITDSMQIAIDCSYAITDGLFQLAAPIEPLSREEAESRRSAANQEITNKCPALNNCME